MQGLKVQYTVKEDYVEENKSKIRAVMDDLREINNPNFKYYATVLEDGRSFLHIVVKRNDDTDDLPNRLDSFKKFQEGLKGNVEAPPEPVNYEVVGSSFDLF